MNFNVKTVQIMFGKEGRGRLRLRHRPPKFTLVSKKFHTKEPSQKTYAATIFKISLPQSISVFSTAGALVVVTV